MIKITIIYIVTAFIVADWNVLDLDPSVRFIMCCIYIGMLLIHAFSLENSVKTTKQKILEIFFL